MRIFLDEAPWQAMPAFLIQVEHVMRLLALWCNATGANRGAGKQAH